MGPRWRANRYGGIPTQAEILKIVQALKNISAPPPLSLGLMLAVAAEGYSRSSRDAERSLAVHRALRGSGVINLF